MPAFEAARHHDVEGVHFHGWLQGWLRNRLGNVNDAADLR